MPMVISPMAVLDPGAVERHDPAAHTLVRARASGVVPRASAPALFACFRDFGGWQRWKTDVPFELLGASRGTEIGAVRSVVFARGEKWLHERLDALDDNHNVITYSGCNYGVRASADEPPYPLSASPFSGSFLDYTSTVRIWPVTVPLGADDAPSAFMEWTGEVWTEASSAAALCTELTEFYSGNIVTLREFFAAQPTR